MALTVWLANSLQRFYPSSAPSRRAGELLLEGAMNENFSFQVGLRLARGERQKVRIEAAGPQGWHIRTRIVGYVPLAHHNTPIEKNTADIEGCGHIPGYVPDPLMDGQELLLPEGETHSFWISVRPGGRARPGKHTVKIRVIPEKGKARILTARIRLHNLRLKKRRNFNITNWFYADALIDWYKTDLFDRRFWQILPAYMQNMAAHGQDTVYVPVFTPPLDGVKRPTQLMRIARRGKDTYSFDWRDVKKYVRLAKKSGITHFEWCHPFTQWGVAHAIRIYEGQGAAEKLLWKPSTGATSKTYRGFLSQYLPRLERFLKEEKISKRSLFHVSDEPHGGEHLKNYRKARALLSELAPWMKVMDALTEIDFARQGLTDMPIPSIRTALDFHQEGIPSWCYYCCGPRGAFLNRLMDTPLAKIAMHGLLFYRWPFRGFLHWGYNYWYQSQTRNLIDPYTAQDGLGWHRGWAYGDTFMVYPGTDGPVDSMRWEIFAESLQDYQLLQTLGVDRNDPCLRPLRSFMDFPKREAWRRGLRARLFAGLTKR